MKKTIITYHGRANEGKSSTIKEVCKQLITPNSQVRTYDGLPVNFNWDILMAIQIGKIKIGIESQGDPGSRMITDNTLRYLADSKFQIKGYQRGLGDCDIIVCASRTSGQTVIKVDEIANKYGYRTLWKGGYYAPSGFSLPYVNVLAANEILNLITEISSNRL